MYVCQTKRCMCVCVCVCVGGGGGVWIVDVEPENGPPLHPQEIIAPIEVYLR